MICHFQGGSRSGTGGGGRPKIAMSPYDAAASLDLLLPPSLLTPVLAGLIGRDVTLLAGGQLHAGRLLRSHPVTLVAAGGRVNLITAPVSSVQF